MSEPRNQGGPAPKPEAADVLGGRWAKADGPGDMIVSPPRIDAGPVTDEPPDGRRRTDHVDVNQANDRPATHETEPSDTLS